VGAGGGILAFVEGLFAVEDDDATLLETLFELRRDPGLPGLEGSGQVLVLAGLDAVEEREGRRLVERQASEVFLKVQRLVESVLGIRE